MTEFKNLLSAGVAFAIDFRKREESFTALYASVDDANKLYLALHDDWNEMSKPYEATLSGSPLAGVTEFNGRKIDYWNEFYKAHHFCVGLTIDEYFKL